jgi:ABC-type phosphate transport system substrate-binding protein
MVRPSTLTVIRRATLAAVERSPLTVMNRSTLTVMKLLSLVGLCLALFLTATVARAQVVAVVSAHSSVRSLSRSELTDICLGRASRFPSGQPAVPIDQAEGSASRDEFYAKFAGKSPAQIKAFWSKIIFTGRGQPPREVADGVEMKKLVAGNPDAIGYIDQKLVDTSVRVVL